MVNWYLTNQNAKYLQKTTNYKKSIYKYWKSDKINTENKKRINEINKILKTAYEDRVNGIIDINEFVTYSESYKKEQEELIQKTENLNLKLQDYENTKEKELIKYIKEIVSFENIDRNIILNLIDSVFNHF